MAVVTLDHSWQHYLKAEAAVMGLTVAGALWPQWQRAAGWMEEKARPLALRPLACFWWLVAASVVLRLLLLLIEPVPQPLFHDEFSYLLGADTFAHGRLTNPTPPVPVAFETIHVNMWPTYQSMYLPGTALWLLLGRLVHLPWASVVLITALFCGFVYWMTAAYLSRSYALAVGLSALVLTGSMNWWYDNYFCLGLTGTAAALVLGSLPRIKQHLTVRATVPFGVGLAVLMLTRPYEGMCLTLPAVLVLVWQLRGAGVRRVAMLSAAPLAMMAAATAWLLYYNWRGTGHPLLFAYMLNYRDYHITGPFLFSKMKAIPLYDLDMLHKFYRFAELPEYAFEHAHPVAFLVKKFTVYYFQFVVGFGAVLVVGAVEVCRRPRQGLSAAVAAGLAGFLTELVLMAWPPFPQYAAPAAALFLLLIGYGMYALRQVRWRLLPGKKLVRGLIFAELLMVVNVLGLRITHYKSLPEPQYVSKDRANVMRQMLAHPGKQLCLVRYTPGHDGWQEWVFNSADIRDQRLIWARSISPEMDRRVMEAFPGRTVWLATPDFADHLLGPYTVGGVYPLPGDRPPGPPPVTP